MDTADKILAALIAGIISLIIISGAIIYVIWSENDETMQEVKMASGSAENENELLLNDDTSIVNNIRGKLWIRAKVIYSEAFDGERCSIKSEAISEGKWIYKDGWYYYSDVLEFTQKTRPLVDEFFYEGQAVKGENKKAFRLYTEAVNEEWLQQKPSSCMEAFDMFMQETERGDIKDL